MDKPIPTPDRWTAVDRYFSDTLVDQDHALRAAIEAQESAGLPAIEVAPVAAKLIALLVRISGARRVLEIGTLGGYSTIWLARALPPEGTVTTIEAEPENAAIARRNVNRAGVGERVDIRIGRAADVLAALHPEAPFDLVFIDADKESNTIYLDWAAKLGRPGTVVVLDNVGRGGNVADPDSTDTMVQGTRAALTMLGEDPRFDATALQTLDRKGWDGIAIGVIVDPAATKHGQ